MELTLYSDKKKGETINPIAYGRHYKHKREDLWHVYMNGPPLKDKNGKAIIYNSKAQPGTKEFDYRFNNKKQKRDNDEQIQERFTIGFRNYSYSLQR